MTKVFPKVPDRIERAIEVVSNKQLERRLILREKSLLVINCVQ
jgi:hypothetical protein